MSRITNRNGRTTSRKTPTNKQLIREWKRTAIPGVGAKEIALTFPEGVEPLPPADTLGAELIAIGGWMGWASRSDERGADGKPATAGLLAMLRLKLEHANKAARAAGNAEVSAELTRTTGLLLRAVTGEDYRSQFAEQQNRLEHAAGLSRRDDGKSLPMQKKTIAAMLNLKPRTFDNLVKAGVYRLDKISHKLYRLHLTDSNLRAVFRSQ
jgi:hypothetical protein